VVPVDKDWMVAGKMVALFWEPHTNDSNAFCASGVHRQIASALQRQGPTEAGLEVWERWQHAFVAAVRRPQAEARIAELEAALGALKTAAQGQPIGVLLEVVPDDAASLAALIPHGEDELDPALSGLVEQLHHWSQRFGKPFRVVHDDSEVVRRWQQLLERLSDRESPRRTFDIGEVHFAYPLFGVEIGTVDSRHSAAVQLADVLAGAVMWCLRKSCAGKRFLGGGRNGGLAASSTSSRERTTSSLVWSIPGNRTSPSCQASDRSHAWTGRCFALRPKAPRRSLASKLSIYGDSFPGLRAPGCRIPSPRRLLHSKCAKRTLDGSSAPPREIGTMWSRVASSASTRSPQIPQSQPSRSKMASRSIGARFAFLSRSARRRFGASKTSAGSWS
jgi:hypothetical protein